jgi:hypothetical protein
MARRPLTTAPALGILNDAFEDLADVVGVMALGVQEAQAGLGGTEGGRQGLVQLVRERRGDGTGAGDAVGVPGFDLESPHLFGITLLLGDICGDPGEGLRLAPGVALQGSARGDPGCGAVGSHDAKVDAGVTAGLAELRESLANEFPVFRVDRRKKSLQPIAWAIGGLIFIAAWF